ncbi:unnamed protein product [Fraxinus pennsylvanica]|uniref:C2 domain-containing protein n=1 Tax=Fraxinus pennsylvanica TaxID=56036 RepID=A0AAD2E7Z5_9LAMI|nr:unnamed protein product [Fraxinus pennsylvanica]
MAFDLVDQMPFLYVRVAKVKISNPEADSSIHAKLVIGTHNVKTKSQAANKDWDQVFAFDKEGLNSTSLEVSVWIEKKIPVNENNNGVSESCIGTVSFDLQETKDGTRRTTDAYVVAKYGPKWVRTRTILDRFNPRWNEQYTWDVYDPCTVLTIGVFDNERYKHDEAGLKKDVRLGKLRVRLSTLDTNRVYVGTYSLMVLLPSRAKKMGKIEIALRSWSSS